VSNKELALSLAVKTLEQATVNGRVDRNHGEWVIELAKKYEAYLGEGSGKRFKLVMESYGHSVLLTIRILKGITGLNLLDAKDFTLHLPQVIKGNLTEEEAIMIKNQFNNSGCLITIEPEKMFN
jgi:ribosomal protein L7/L12